MPGFRVQGSGFRVQGSGFRVRSGFRVQGVGCRGTCNTTCTAPACPTLGEAHCTRDPSRKPLVEIATPRPVTSEDTGSCRWVASSLHRQRSAAEGGTGALPSASSNRTKVPPRSGPEVGQMAPMTTASCGSRRAKGSTPAVGTPEKVSVSSTTPPAPGREGGEEQSTADDEVSVPGRLSRPKAHSGGGEDGKLTPVTVTRAPVGEDPADGLTDVMVGTGAIWKGVRSEDKSAPLHVTCCVKQEVRR